MTPATSGPPEITPSRGRALPPFVRRFLETESAGGALLVVAAIGALAWSNSPWGASYEATWHTPVSLRVGTVGFDDDLRHFVNDGLMAAFFLVVGLEIKRELVSGELRDPRVAALPVFAALGGMAVPAAIYALANAGHEGAPGWGVPMATDIAFALGVLSLLGRRVPPSLKLFLLTLAIVDDIGAILVIAVFYARELDALALAIAALAIFMSVALRSARVHFGPLHAALGVVCWVATHASGVHATLAGVAFGLITPARPTSARRRVSPAERVEMGLHPVTSYAVVPLFALANAGVALTGGVLSGTGATRVAVGVAAGLVVGKLVGITGASWLAVRSGGASLPPGVTWTTLAGAGALAGIGFTVSLFVAGLAFEEDALQDAAKLAVLAASVVASLIGLAVLALSTRGAASR